MSLRDKIRAKKAVRMLKQAQRNYNETPNEQNRVFLERRWKELESYREKFTPEEKKSFAEDIQTEEAKRVLAGAAPRKPIEGGAYDYMTIDGKKVPVSPEVQRNLNKLRREIEKRESEEEAWGRKKDPDNRKVGRAAALAGMTNWDRLFTPRTDPVAALTKSEGIKRKFGSAVDDPEEIDILSWDNPVILAADVLGVAGLAKLGIKGAYKGAKALIENPRLLLDLPKSLQNRIVKNAELVEKFKDPSKTGANTMAALTVAKALDLIKDLVTSGKITTKEAKRLRRQADRGGAENLNQVEEMVSQIKKLDKYDDKAVNSIITGVRNEAKVAQKRAAATDKVTGKTPTAAAKARGRDKDTSRKTGEQPPAAKKAAAGAKGKKVYDEDKLPGPHKPGTAAAGKIRGKKVYDEAAGPHEPIGRAGQRVIKGKPEGPVSFPGAGPGRRISRADRAVEGAGKTAKVALPGALTAAAIAALTPKEKAARDEDEVTRGAISRVPSSTASKKAPASPKPVSKKSKKAPVSKEKIDLQIEDYTHLPKQPEPDADYVSRPKPPRHALNEGRADRKRAASADKKAVEKVQKEIETRYGVDAGKRWAKKHGLDIKYEDMDEAGPENPEMGYVDLPEVKQSKGGTVKKKKPTKKYGARQGGFTKRGGIYKFKEM